jgi:hypothetical protein
MVPLELDILFDDVGLKHSLHKSHDKWQKYGVALKRSADYTPAIATTYNVSDDVYHKVTKNISDFVLGMESPTVWYLEVVGGTDEGVPILIPPHVDDFRVCTINFYLEASGEVTTFYNYQKGSMENLGSFSAKSGECWILNTNVPHSVRLVPGKTRRVLGVSFLRTPYSVISSSLP